MILVSLFRVLLLQVRLGNAPIFAIQLLSHGTEEVVKISSKKNLFLIHIII